MRILLFCANSVLKLSAFTHTKQCSSRVREKEASKSTNHCIFLKSKWCDVAPIIFIFPLPWQHIVKWHAIKKTYVQTRLIPMTKMIVFQDKLGQETIFMNVNLIAVSMENNVFCAWHYVCKCLYWRTSMRVPNFMLVSKSAQFT